MRELPETIERLKTRLAETLSDEETARANEHEPVVIRGVTCPRDKLVPVLGKVLRRPGEG